MEQGLMDDKPTVARRLDYIDGLRGTAILLVILTHYDMECYKLSPPRWTGMGLGYVGVHLFLLLSGFCLAWPVLGPRQRPVRWWDYAERRATRILPPYYVALGIFLFLALPMAPGEFFFQAITHLSMTFNLFQRTADTLNPAFWSLALECQLYLFFPLLIYGYRKIGFRGTVTLVLLVEVIFRLWISHKFGNHTDARQHVLSWSVIGRLFDFTLGNVAALIIGRSYNRPIRSHYIKLLPVVMAICFALGIVFKAKLSAVSVWTDLAWTIGFFALLIYCSVKDTWAARVMSLRPLVWLGTFSYSVYLIHNLVIVKLCQRIVEYGGGKRTFFLMLLPSVAITIFVGYIFYLLVERPSIRYFENVRNRRLSP